MKDYHSLFYRKILGRLKELRTGDSIPVYDSDNGSDEGRPQFLMGYEPRQGEFRHQYQREKFLNTRNRYMLVGRGRSAYAIFLQENMRNGEITLYKEAIRYAFPDDFEAAFDELQKLLEKFYNVTVEDRHHLQQIDYSMNRHENLGSVHEV